MCNLSVIAYISYVPYRRMNAKLLRKGLFFFFFGSGGLLQWKCMMNICFRWVGGLGVEEGDALALEVPTIECKN